MPFQILKALGLKNVTKIKKAYKPILPSYGKRIKAPKCYFGDTAKKDPAATTQNIFYPILFHNISHR